MRRITCIILTITTLLICQNGLKAQVGIAVTVNVAPPPLPVYEQPVCPAEGYIWCPGYWAYTDDGGYYWVPGVWVPAPEPGLLWTPGYWGYAGGVYGWYPGYWGPHVGYYGGVCYGFGYTGVGFYGGRWAGGVYEYNTAVVHVNTTVIHNTYINNSVPAPSANRASFNGAGGVRAQPTAQEKEYMNERHLQATSAQVSHQATAKQDKAQFYSSNHGKPATAAMNKPQGEKFAPNGHLASAGAAKSAAPTHATSPAHTNPSPPSKSAAPVNHAAAPHNTAPLQSNKPAAPHNNNPAPVQHNNPSTTHHNNPAPIQHDNPTPHTSPAPERHAAPAPVHNPGAVQHAPAPRPQPMPHPAPAPAEHERR